MVVTDAGMVTFESEVPFSNAQLPIACVQKGITTPLRPSKAEASWFSAKPAG